MSKQPLKKNIKELGYVKEPDKYVMLVDGSNLLKVCFHGDKSTNSRGELIGALFQFLKQIRALLLKRNFDHVYVFFDGENSGKLRYEMYHEYKANRNKTYSEYDKFMKSYVKKVINYSKLKKGQIEESKKDEDELFNEQKSKIHEYLEELFIRQVIIPEIESDDLIAYYCKHKKPNEKIYIVSSDADLTQLMDVDVAIWNPRKKKFITIDNCSENHDVPHYNILLKKIICGDSSDNIKGIKQIGEETLYKIIPEIKTQKITLDDVFDRVKILSEERKQNKLKPLKAYDNILNSVTDGSQGNKIYKINKVIIDLGNPLLTPEAKKEMDEIMHAPLDPEGRELKNLYELIIRDDIYDLIYGDKFTNFFLSFKYLMDKEIDLYNESIL